MRKNFNQIFQVFYTNSLMRMRLTPDATSMVISTRNGYLIVIHDLDLSTMGQDLAGFFFSYFGFTHNLPGPLLGLIYKSPLFLRHEVTTSTNYFVCPFVRLKRQFARSQLNTCSLGTLAIALSGFDLHILLLMLLCLGFKPNMYHLMQVSGKAFEQAVTYTRYFKVQRQGFFKLP